MDLACLGRFGAAVAGTLLTTAGPLLDPARGAEVAKRLRGLGVKGILVGAAELGYITEVSPGCPKASAPKSWVVLGTSNRSVTDTATGI